MLRESESKRILYRSLCSKLEKFHSILDPCGFKFFNKGRCWQGLPCCHSGGTCDYLSDYGCTTHSLSCLLWLCKPAIDYLTQIASNTSDPLYIQANAYLDIRPHFARLAERHIPLQQRASEDDTFYYLEEDPLLAEIPYWFDDWDGLPWDNPNGL